MEFNVKNYFGSHQNLFANLDENSLLEAVDLIKKKFEAGKKIITCGNGGSAHTASHYITDWNKMTYTYTGKQFKGLCLCDNVGLITAFANDYDYSEVFSGQLKSILEKDDLVIGVSGSGNSENVIKAIDFANTFGADTLGIVGYDGGKLKEVAKYNFWVPSYDMQLCEDIHLMFGHITMKALCNSDIR